MTDSKRINHAFGLNTSRAPEVSRSAHEKRSDYRHDPAALTVLVEEDARVCRFWREFFDEKKMPLKIFRTPEAFCSWVGFVSPEFAPESSGVQFYFDQDFGRRRRVGIRLAEMVRDWPKKISACLVTAYPAECFKKELKSGLIDRVFDKFPEPVFGPDYFIRRFKREMDPDEITMLVEEDEEWWLNRQRDFRSINPSYTTGASENVIFAENRFRNDGGNTQCGA